MKQKKIEPPKSWHIDQFRTHDGKNIRYAVIDPMAAYKGKVVLLGGYGQDIEYYRKAIKKWAQRGYKVYAMDLYGQGGSDREDPNSPDKPSVLGFEGHADILHEFTTKVVQPDPDKTNILSAHSQSGGIVPVYLEKHEKTKDFAFNLAILGSPLFALNTLGQTPGKLFRAFVYAADFMGLGSRSIKIPPPASLLNAFRKAANDNPTDYGRITFRNDTYPAMMAYPTVSWFRSYFESEKKLTSAFFKAIKTPVLIISPAQDPFVCIEAKKHAANHLQDAEIVFIPKAQHGLWYHGNAKVQRALWDAIDNFISKYTNKPHTPPKKQQPPKPQ